MSKVYIYVVARDFGFAPNPFHGVCSLATCKPQIRNTAAIDDWVFGVGGSRLKATGKCIFAMKVTRKVSFNQYWENPEFLNKKPVRNGSKVMMLGDNIYYQNNDTKAWTQALSHHSNPDGSINQYNLDRDTKSSNVLLSTHFYYFGKSAPLVPPYILQEIGYRNRRGHSVFDYNTAIKLVDWVEEEYKDRLNLVLSDPFDFHRSHSHYSTKTNRIT
ncbi:hypothetical protein V9K67_09055 [Paraflavisolibacter sp. H34]|uniref:Nmad2 family putative nucleotide modification protein n=1 Tax=Huijunlia imazamoxiresistens TaxID=3127457 RepID=UPI0030183666